VTVDAVHPALGVVDLRRSQTGILGPVHSRPASHTSA
jgi:hypothetical protein